MKDEPRLTLTLTLTVDEARAILDRLEELRREAEEKAQEDLDANIKAGTI